LHQNPYEQASRIIESGKCPKEKMHTRPFPLEQVEHAIKVLARTECRRDK
jgi:hypothetical protein